MSSSERVRTSLPAPVEAVLAYARKLDAETFEAWVGNPVRSLSDKALWAYLRLVMPPEDLGMLIADGVADAGRNKVELPLSGDVLEAWAAWEQWGATVGDTPQSVTELGAAAAADAWGTWDGGA